MPNSRSISLTCDNCGAMMGPAGPDNIARCEYCGHKVEVQRAPSPQPAPPAPVRPPQYMVPTARPRGVPKALFIIMGLMVLLGGAVPMLIAMFSRSSGVGGGLPSFSGEHLIWDTTAGPPLITKIDGKEHLIGRIRRVPGDDQLMVAVIESATVKERWRTPPLGKYIQAYQSSPFALAAGKLLVADFKNILHIYDLASGKEIKTQLVTDKVKQICPLKDGTKVWIQVADEHHLTFDLEQLKGEPGMRPQYCPENAWMARHTRSEVTEPVPVVQGFEHRKRMQEGDLAVVYGVKHPGTAVPMAVGFAPETRQVRWKRIIPTVDPTTVREVDAIDDLAGGRYVAAYGVGSDLWRVVAIDARSGDTIWDAALRDIFAVDQINSLTLTPKFVYIVRTSSMEVHDAASGKLLGTVGHESYE